MKRPHPSGDQHWTRRAPERLKRGAAAQGAKLTPEEYETIRSEFAQGRATQVELAHRYGVARITIWRHVHGRHE